MKWKNNLNRLRSQSDDFTHFCFDNEHAKMISNFSPISLIQKYKIVWGSAVTPPGHICARTPTKLTLI